MKQKLCHHFYQNPSCGFVDEIIFHLLQWLFLVASHVTKLRQKITGLAKFLLLKLNKFISLNE